MSSDDDDDDNDDDDGEDDGEDDGVMGSGTSSAITREFSSKWQLLANNLQMGSPFFLERFSGIWRIS